MIIQEYDGIPKLWFESAEDLMEAMSSPEEQKLVFALLEDEKNFIDHSIPSAFIFKEHEL
jgi:hypothetical protein